MKSIPKNSPFGLCGQNGEYYIINRTNYSTLPSNTVSYWTGHENRFKSKKKGIAAVWLILERMYNENPGYNNKFI